MDVYVVRLTGSRELIGIIAAPTMASLAHIVDERTDPSQCEAMRMEMGGLLLSCTERVPALQRRVWDDNHEEVLGREWIDEDGKERADPDFFRGASTTESGNWDAVFRKDYDDPELDGWRPLMSFSEALAALRDDNDE